MNTKLNPTFKVIAMAAAMLGDRGLGPYGSLGPFLTPRKKYREPKDEKSEEEIEQLRTKRQAEQALREANLLKAKANNPTLKK